MDWLDIVENIRDLGRLLMQINGLDICNEKFQNKGIQLIIDAKYMFDDVECNDTIEFRTSSFTGYKKVFLKASSRFLNAANFDMKFFKESGYIIGDYLKVSDHDSCWPEGFDLNSVDFIDAKLITANLYEWDTDKNNYPIKDIKIIKFYDIDLSSKINFIKSLSKAVYPCNIQVITYYGNQNYNSVLFGTTAYMITNKYSTHVSSTGKKLFIIRKFEFTDEKLNKISRGKGVKFSYPTFGQKTEDEFVKLYSENFITIDK